MTSSSLSSLASSSVPTTFQERSSFLGVVDSVLNVRSLWVHFFWGGCIFHFLFWGEYLSEEMKKLCFFLLSLLSLRENWPPLRRARVTVLEIQNLFIQKNKKNSYQILRGRVFQLSSWYTGIGFSTKLRSPFTAARSCVVRLQAVQFLHRLLQ